MSVEMSQEQFMKLIEIVKEAAISRAATAAEEAANVKSKGSFSNCTSRYGGERSHEMVEEFITSIKTYKDVEKISDEDALKGLSLLFYGMASTWWQGIRKEANTWDQAIALIQEHFAPVKLPYQVYMEIFHDKQDETTSIDQYICQKRALLAQLPDERHDEETQLDLIYGLLNIKYRKYIQRLDVKTFKELLEKGRIIEQNEQELGSALESGNVRGSKKQKRCTYCSFRGHTYQECRKRKQSKAASAAAAAITGADEE